MLAMPLDMGVADFCSFVGAYLPKLREMRVVRREDGKSVCLILLHFDSLETADSFFHDFHDKPVSPMLDHLPSASYSATHLSSYTGWYFMTA